MSHRDAGFPNEGGEIHAYVETLRRHKWLIALVTVTVLGLIMLQAFLQTPLYGSSAQILLRPTTSFLTGGYFNIQTESKLVTSEGVAQLVAEEIDFEGDVSDLLADLSVTVSEQTEILVITDISTDPQEAQQRAQAFAEGFLEFRTEELRRDLELTSTRIALQIGGLNQRVATLTRQLNRATTDEQRNNLQVQINTLVSQLALFEQQRIELIPPTAVELGDVVQPATLPTAPFSPSYTQNLILGLFFGVLAGLALALLRERLDDRLRGRQDLEHRLGRPILAVIPRTPSARRAQGPSVVALTQPHSIASEAYKTLRTSTLFLASSQGSRVFLMTGPHEGEGKTTTLANLGVALANADRRVILVAGDLRKPRLHDFFDIPIEPGLMNVLVGEVELHEALFKVGVDKLRVIPSGLPPSNPAEILGSEAMGELLEELREVADLVLVDSPPVLGVADPLILAPHSDGVIFVVDAARSTRSSVTQAKTQLEQVNAVILGGVLNNFEPSRDFPYSYQYPAVSSHRKFFPSREAGEKTRSKRQARP